MLKNIKFSDTDKTMGIITLHLFCIKMFLEAIPTSLKKFHRRKLEKSRGKRRKILALYFELVVAMTTIFRKQITQMWLRECH